MVLDYKTDQVKTADQLVEKYHAQLDYYAKAWNSFWADRSGRRSSTPSLYRKKLFCRDSDRQKRVKETAPLWQ